MTSQTRAKVATQVNPETPFAVRGFARDEGRRSQMLVEEALSHLIEPRKQEPPRAEVMAAYQASHAKFASLCKKRAERWTI